MKIEKISVPAKFYLGKTATVAIDQLEHHPIFNETYPAVAQYAQEKSIPFSLGVAIYKAWNPQENSTTVMPAFEVPAESEAGAFEVFEVPANDAYVAIHKGSYAGLKDAHQHIMDHLNELQVPSPLTIEEYTIAPMEGVSEDDLETRILYYT